MHTMKMIKDVSDDYTGQAELWLMDEGKETEQYLVLSSTYVMFGGQECLAFKANGAGDVEDWLDVAGGKGMSILAVVADIERDGIDSWEDYNED
jgi:hypothetical protein